MVKRFSVSVPDELGERFELFKDKMSPSTIFQKALEIAVAREERMAQTITEGIDMAEIIERLKTEKAEVVQEMYNKGRKDGAEWAKNSHYLDLSEAIKFEIPVDGYGNLMDFSDHRDDEHTLPYLLSEFYNDHPNLAPNDEGLLSNEAEQYINGLFVSINDFWDQVKDQL